MAYAGGGREQPINGKPVFIYGKENQTDKTGKAIKVDSDGNIILTGDIEIGAVEIKDSTSDQRVTVDANGAMKVTGGASSVAAEYMSPSDFTAAYTSTTTITLSGVPLTISDSSQVQFITAISAAGVAATYVNGANGISMTISSNVLTIAGVTTPFASGDVYQIGINAQQKAYDPSSQSSLVSVLNPDTSRYTDAELLVTASDIGAADGTYIDQGAEIDMNGYNVLGIFVKFTVSDSTTNTIKLLTKHTSAGTEEFVLETAGDYIKTLGDSNINIYYEFETSHTMPFLQIQSAAADVDTGGGTEGTLEIYITKGNK